MIFSIDWRFLRTVCYLISIYFGSNHALFALERPSVNPVSTNTLYRWVDNPTDEIQRVAKADQRLDEAIKNPEYMLDHWVELPTSPPTQMMQIRHLSLKEAILLALRYNPNIQNAELDRIIQRYQLRLAHNQFELQYALAGTAATEKSWYSGVGTTSVQSYLVTPEVNLKNRFGSQLSLTMPNNVSTNGNYNPLLNFTFTQPLLRGFGKAANEAGLLDAIDSEQMNKLILRQSVIDQITQVISAYRALILSGNNLQNQQRQLAESKKSYSINEKKIAAGQLEPTANIQPLYQIESLKLMVEQAENDLKTTTQDLLQTIGLDPDMKVIIPNDVTLDDLNVPDVNKSIAQALNHNTQFMALKMALRADERAYEVAKNQQRWQLDLNANIQTGTLTEVAGNRGVLGGLHTLYSGRNVSESAGVILKIPIRDLSLRSQLITAKVRLEKDRLILIATKRALITTIKNTISTIQSQAKRYELAKRQMDLAAQSYDLEKKKRQAGIASALDVNNTQNQLILAQIGLINAKIAYLNQLTSLQRILGTSLDYWQIKLRYAG